jgi:hypothetical protein
MKERMHEAKKPKLNGVKQISILSPSISKRKPDMRGAG